MKKPQSSQISDISNLAENAKVFLLEEENKNLAATNVGLSQTIDKLLAQLEEKTSEIRHLQDMLSKSVPIIGEAQKFIVSDEEVIADMQLKALKSAAMIRDLTLDEVKRYDLLVKNKRLAQGNATTIEAKPGVSKATPQEKLIQIAKKKIITSEEQ